MSVRSAVAVALAAAVGLAAPALARSHGTPAQAKTAALRPSAMRGVDPARVLAARSGQDFSGRTANMTSILGPETSVVRLQIPLRPEHPRGMRREADATASLK